MKTKGYNLMTIVCRNPEGILKCDPVPKRELREGNWFCVCSRCNASYVVDKTQCPTCGGAGTLDTLEVAGIQTPGPF